MACRTLPVQPSASLISSAKQFHPTSSIRHALFSYATGKNFSRPVHSFHRPTLPHPRLPPGALRLSPAASPPPAFQPSVAPPAPRTTPFHLPAAPLESPGATQFPRAPRLRPIPGPAEPLESPGTTQVLHTRAPAPPHSSPAAPIESRPDALRALRSGRTALFPKQSYTGMA